MNTHNCALIYIGMVKSKKYLSGLSSCKEVFPWLRGQRHLTEHKNLRLLVQSAAMPANFQPGIAKKLEWHP